MKFSIIPFGKDSLPDNKIYQFFSKRFKTEVNDGTVTSTPGCERKNFKDKNL